METRGGPQPLHKPPPVPNAQQMPSRVNPNYPLPSSFPSPPTMDQSPLPGAAQAIGVARTTSQRRRQVSGKSQSESTRQPTAPQVPKAPPVSYRDPYGNGAINSPTANATSFAARIRAAPPDLISARIPDEDFDSVIQGTTANRRGSNSRPPGALYAAVQSSNRAPISSPTTGPSSPPFSSNTATPRQYQSPDPKPSQPTSDTIKPARAYDDTAYPVSRSKSRRVSGGAAESPTEWAADRSPLQKLEVKLNDISKEEKRARVEEAEQLLRESKTGSRPRRSSQEIESTSHRRQSRRASAGTDGTSRSVLPGEAREAQKEVVVREDRGVSSRNRAQPELTEAKSASQPERLQNFPRNEVDRHSNSTRIPTASRLPVSRDRSRPISGGPPEAAEPGQLSGRGVRFQSQRPPNEPGLTSGVDSEPLSRHSGTTKVEESGFGSSARGARTISQQDRLPRDQPIMGNKASKQASPQQQSLRNRNVESSKSNAFPAADGGAANPVSAKIVPKTNDALNYNVPPQIAGGIDAREKNEFKGSPNGVTDEPVHRKHHLSSILHRSRQHEPALDERSTSRSKPLDEWRQGGTARLTISDMSPRNDTVTRQSAWWEGRGSNGGKIKNRKRTETKSLDGGYDETYGKNSFSSLQNTNIVSPPEVLRGLGAAHARRYVANDDLQGGRQRDHLGLRGHVFHSRENRQLDLSTAYSYSCPHLDEHDDSHPYHICKPYVSRELTRSMRSIRIRAAPPTASFNPPLYLKCGPLLRYTGLKRETLPNSGGISSKTSTERETWRGSVMIVTVDADSTYNPAPILRLFPEPIDLLPPPPQQVDDGSNHSLPHEYIDPIAGLPKLSRTGKTIYVKPVEDLEVQVDLSRVEDDAGLFEETRTAAVPTSYGQPNNRPRRDISSASTSARNGRGDRDASIRYQQTKGVRLYAERGVTFWRFNIEVELGERQVRIAYRINNSASVGFWVPARGQTMNVMFHSCNGFSMSVK